MFDGQSLNNTVSPGTRTFPDFAMSGLGVPWSVVAVTGEGWVTLAGTASTRCHPQVKPTTATHLVMTGGTADITNGDSAATLYGRFADYADAARTAGFTTVTACTIQDGVQYATGDRNTRRLDTNTLLIADASLKFDHVVDLASVTGLDDYTSEMFAFDQVHPSDAGAELMGDTLRPTINSIIAP